MSSFIVLLVAILTTGFSPRRQCGRWPRGVSGLVVTRIPEVSVCRR
jgi:hypothetical protein